MKLTARMVETLRALRRHPQGTVSIAMWGGKPFAGMPAGIKSTGTLEALRRRSLVAVRSTGLRSNWTITPAGLSALKEQETGE